MTQSADPRQWDCEEARIALGVYVLGAIDPAEQALVEAHLDTCDTCQAEMAELADLVPVLALVPAEEAARVREAGEPTGPAALADVVGIPEARAPQRAPASEDKRGSGQPWGPEAKREDLTGAAGREDRTPGKRGVRGVGVYPPGKTPYPPGKTLHPPGKKRFLAVAAAAVVIGAASFGGVKLAAGPSGQDPHYAVGASNGPWQTWSGSSGTVAGTVAYRSVGWGTQLAARIAGLPVNTPCQLWIVEGNGTRIAAGGWDTDANEGSVWYPGSAPVAATAIKSFVITIQGRQPVTIQSS